MILPKAILTPVLAVVLTAFIGCAPQTDQSSTVDDAGSAFAGIDRAVAVLHPTAGNSVEGVVHFRQTSPTTLQVKATIRGLEPGSEHGFHVHEYGDCTAADATSAGGHYDPEDVGHHGMPGDERRHAGDMGNLKANDQGVAEYEQTLQNVSISNVNAVLGRAVIVHAKPDTGGQPTGEAGARISCGVIGVAGPETETAE